MSDLVNALRSAGGSRELPAPVVLNPLAAMSGAVQTAHGIYQLRQEQANEALGQVYQQAIDPATGRFDPLKFNTLLSQTPGAAMSAKGGVESGQTLQGQQFTLNAATNNLINGAVATALKEQDDTKLPGVVIEQAQRLIDAGFPRDRIMSSLLNLSSDGATMRQQLERLRIQTLPPDQAQTSIYGQPFRYTAPGGVERGGVQSPQTGAVSTPAQPGAQLGMGPADRMSPTQVYVPVDKDGNPTTPDKATEYRQITVPKYTVPGFQEQPAPGGTATNPPGVPPPGTVGSPGRINPVPDNTALRNPNAAKPPATPGAPGGPALAAPPQSQPAQLTADLEARNKDLAAIPQQQTSVQNLKHAWDALAFITTGKGQQLPNDVFNALAGFGLLPQGAVNRLEKYEEYKKYTAMQILQQGLLQGTDLGRQLAGSSNPSELLSTAANRELLRNNIGKAIQEMAAATAEKDKTAPGAASGYIGRRSDIANNTDPRGFAWSLYTPEEQQKILKEVAKDKVADAKLHRAIGMADALRLNVPFPSGNAQP